MQQALKISDGTLTLGRTKVVSNKGTALEVTNNTQFTIVGNLFMSNGNTTITNGGVAINSTNTGGPNRFDFNTVTNNASRNSGTSGVFFNVSADTIASNNIITKNTSPDMSAPQVDGSNKFSYSFIFPTAPANKLDGGNNTVSDPKLAPDGKPLLDSPIKGKAQPTASISGDLATDLDGNMRTVRAGAGADPGAYVVPEQ